MSSDIDVRSRYLALALDARKVIDALIVFVDQGKREQGLDESLEDAIGSLQAATEKKDFFSPLSNRVAFSEYYEQVRTIEEALKPEQREEVIRKLLAVKDIKDNQADIARQTEDAYQAIKLLSAIESRALHYYRPQP